MATASLSTLTDTTGGTQFELLVDNRFFVVSDLARETDISHLQTETGLISQGTGQVIVMTGVAMGIITIHVTLGAHVDHQVEQGAEDVAEGDVTITSGAVRISSDSDRGRTVLVSNATYRVRVSSIGRDTAPDLVADRVEIYRIQLTPEPRPRGPKVVRMTTNTARSWAASGPMPTSPSPGVTVGGQWTRRSGEPPIKRRIAGE